MSHPVLIYGNPLLREKAAPVESINEEVLVVIERMKATIKEYNCVGLAAPQIGSLLHICLVGSHETDFPMRVFINPKLSQPSKEAWIHEEGSPCIPGIYLPVKRPLSITVEALDIDGQAFTERLTEWPARILMHENDYLHGTLFIDRADPKEKRALSSALSKLKKQSKN